MKTLYLLIPSLLLSGCSTLEKSHNTRINSPLTIEKSADNKMMKPAGQNRQKEVLTPPNKAVEQSGGSSQQKDSVLLDVVLIKQNPELKYGCEVTSLAMVLNYAGIRTNKMELYTRIIKDPDPLIKSTSGIPLKWGNPNDGFVGDMTGKSAGYAVYEKPMLLLIERYLPGRSLNLTNQPFEKVLKHVSDGFPVVVWTTGDYRLPDRWESWYHGQQLIQAPLDLHAVVLVGYNKNFIYLNDPLSGKKQVPVAIEQFITTWNAMKRRAVSYL